MKFVIEDMMQKLKETTYKAQFYITCDKTKE